MAGRRRSIAPAAIRRALMRGGLTTAGLFDGAAAQAPVFGPHRYWRVEISGNHGGNVQAASRLTMHSSVGGPDILQGSGATITASSTFGGYDVNNLIDGNDTTDWASSTGATQNLDVDLGAGNEADVVEVGLRGRDDASEQSPRVGRVLYSDDGVTYAEAWAWPVLPLDHPGQAAMEVLRMRPPVLMPTPAGGARRIWGIRINTIQAGTVRHIQKLDLKIGGTSIVSGGRALAASGYDSSYQPADGFSGAGQGFAFKDAARSILLYDFGEGNESAKPEEVAITASGWGDRSPTDFDLVYQDGIGSALTVQQNFTTLPTWIGGETRTFAVT